MLRWNLERKLVAGILALFLVPTIIAGGLLLALYRRGMLADPYALIVTVLVGFAAMMAYLGVMAHSIGRSLVRTLQEIQRGTELMATVNPDYRHQLRTGDEMESVAEEINRMADRVRDARLDLEAEVGRATRDLDVERNKLSAILEDLDEGVVVAGLDGCITLANRAAMELLGAGEGLLGRLLFEFVDREKLRHFGDRLRAAPATVERFTLHPAGGVVLQAGMTCFVDGKGQTTGFILALRDVSRPARQDEAQLRLLSDAARGLRGSLSSIRSLSESLLSDAAALGTSVRPLVAAIHAEAVRLSALVVEMDGGDRLGRGRAPVHFEEIAVADLVAMSLRRLRTEGADPSVVAVDEFPTDLPSIKGEVSALSAALASLLQSVLGRRNPEGTAWGVRAWPTWKSPSTHRCRSDRRDASPCGRSSIVTPGKCGGMPGPGGWASASPCPRGTRAPSREFQWNRCPQGRGWRARDSPPGLVPAKPRQRDRPSTTFPFSSRWSAICAPPTESGGSTR